MKIIKHTRGMDESTYVPFHDVTLRISQDTIDDIALYLDANGQLESDFKQIFGNELMDRVIKPLIEKQPLGT